MFSGTKAKTGEERRGDRVGLTPCVWRQRSDESSVERDVGMLPLQKTGGDLGHLIVCGIRRLAVSYESRDALFHERA